VDQVSRFRNAHQLESYLGLRRRHPHGWAGAPKFVTRPTISARRPRPDRSVPLVGNSDGGEGRHACANVIARRRSANSARAGYNDHSHGDTEGDADLAATRNTNQRSNHDAE
jgi:hypothetical protein